MTFIYTLIFYIVSVIWCRQTVKHYKKVNSYNTNIDDLVVTLVPFVNTMFALFFTIEFAYKWIAKKFNIKVRKIDFDEVARKFFGE